MQQLRRFASFVAMLVFLTSGPLGAWHVASELVPAAPCHPVAAGSAVSDAHDLHGVPEGTPCVACHLLQHVRGPLSAVATIGDRPMRQVRLVAPDAFPTQLALLDLLPARAPPIAQS
jgi:hypothetical protein